MNGRSWLLSALGISLLLVGCLPATRRLHPSATGGAANSTIESTYSAPTIGFDRRSVLQEAELWLGVPYSYGGNTKAGVDCSGFVCNVFRSIDIKLPRTSAEQSGVGEPVHLSIAQPGDLVFFNTSGTGVSHVGILLNTDQFVHASTSNGVIVSSLSEAYYRERLVGVRRVLR